MEHSEREMDRRTSVHIKCVKPAVEVIVPPARITPEEAAKLQIDDCPELKVNVLPWRESKVPEIEMPNDQNLANDFAQKFDIGTLLSQIRTI